MPACRLALAQAGDGFGLARVGGHLHQFDAVAFGIGDPGLAVAIKAGDDAARDRDAASFQLGHRHIEIGDGDAEVAHADRLARRGLAGAVREEFEVLIIGQAQVDEHQIAVVAVQPEHLGAIELLHVETDDRVEILRPDRQMPDTGLA